MLKPEVLTDEQAEGKAEGLSFDHLPSKSEVHRTIQRDQTYQDTVRQIVELLEGVLIGDLSLEDIIKELQRGVEVNQRDKRREMSSEEFVEILIKKAEQAVIEYKELLHELKRLELKNVRALEYLGELNSFLISKGYEPVPLEETGSKVEG